jgi:hypothetical protein
MMRVAKATLFIVGREGTGRAQFEQKLSHYRAVLRIAAIADAKRPA